jgi:hypothetical protein
VPQAMVQGASWRLLRLRHDAVLALGLRRGGLCAVLPARGCGAGRGVGRRGMRRPLLPDAVLHRRRRQRERGPSGGYWRSLAGQCSALHGHGLTVGEAYRPVPARRLGLGLRPPHTSHDCHAWPTLPDIARS